MSDLAIKLFGTTIPFANNNKEVVCAADERDDDSGKANLNMNHQDQACFADLINKDGEGCSGVELKRLDKEDTGEGEQTMTKQGDAAATTPTSEQCTNTGMASVVHENSKLPPSDKDSAPEKVSKPDEEQSDTSTSQEKTLKKPDKKIPCPRCNSMETKFCYYNNYNVNQPRYFCKKCQRYWTDGGTMRNVPVGAGRRKSKNPASHYRHISVAESLQNAQNHLQNSVHHPSLNANGTVLTFGSDTPLCESMASVLSLAQKSMRNCTENGFHAPQEIRIASSYGGGESSSEHSNASSVSATWSKEEKKKTVLPDSMMHNGQGFTPPMACYPGVPWPYSWNPAQWTPSLAQPAFCPPGYPMPFYPTPGYCGCPVPPPWNVPWVPQPSSPKVITTGSGPDSPTLGKHSRDENLSKADHSGGEKQSKECDTGRSLWIPKTLRIDDPGEAAKSSIWTTLGIKKDKTDPISTDGGLYKAFQSNCDEKITVSGTSLVLQANPAALSRSLNFQESS